MFLFNLFTGYLILRIISNNLKNRDLQYYLPSIIHGCFLGGVSTLRLLELINNQQMMTYYQFSFGYILFDIIDNHSTYKIDMHAHHFLMLLSLSFPYLMEYNIFIKNEEIYYILARIYICEFTNIFLNGSILLYKLNYNNNILKIIFNSFAIISYFFLRIYNFTNIQYRLFSHINEYFCQCIFFIPFLLLNYYWFFLILKKAKSIFF